MKKSSLVSVIIVNWNGLHFLPDCFSSLYRQMYKNIEIIFVDNASTDDSVSWVKKQYPKTVIVRNKRNLGFAEGNNQGFLHAKGEYILFLNNDTKMLPKAIVTLVNAIAEDSTIAGAQSKLLLMDDPKRLDTVGAFLTWTGFLFHYGLGEYDSKAFNKSIDLYTAKGASMIFKKSVLDSIKINGNLFDSDYFCYFEETDLCHRIWIAGFRIIFVPSSVVYHKLGGTSTTMNNAFVQYHSFKNRINSYLKNLERQSLLRLLPQHLFYCQGFAFLSLLKGNISLFWSIQRAIWWNIHHIGETLHKRKYVNTNIRIVADKKLWTHILKNQRLGYYLNIASKLS